MKLQTVLNLYTNSQISQKVTNKNLRPVGYFELFLYGKQSKILVSEVLRYILLVSPLNSIWNSYEDAEDTNNTVEPLHQLVDLAEMLSER